VSGLWSEPQSLGGVAVEIAQNSAARAKVRQRIDSPVNVLTVEFRKSLVGPTGTFKLNIRFRAESGISILFGPSGAGKTTLLDCVAGLNTPDSGTIKVGDHVFFNDAAGVNVSVQQRHIAYVFQDLALFPHLSASGNVAYGLGNLDRSVRQQRCETILESLRISHLRDRKPGEISGGERQRVALARALVTEPCVLLLDEPLAALDAPTKSKIIDDLRLWSQEHPVPILYVTHSREEVFALGEQVLVLEDGRLIAQGTPHEVMTAPRQESVAQLVGFENILDANVIAVHPDRGTMTCRLSNSRVELETPLVRAEIGALLRVGIRAGDILLATVRPQGLSARNIIAGRVVSLEQHDVIVTARVDCGVAMNVHLTLAARDSLDLQPGGEVWLIVKTHSCHLMVN